ncbi:MAG: hypothetical protein FWG02_09530 [Holophagaceae bacterium]|nr:hypothetical protein [Holophagaceae bacterium]
MQSNSWISRLAFGVVACLAVVGCGGDYYAPERAINKPPIVVEGSLKWKKTGTDKWEKSDTPVIAGEFYDYHVSAIDPNIGDYITNYEWFFGGFDEDWELEEAYREITNIPEFTFMVLLENFIADEQVAFFIVSVRATDNHGAVGALTEFAVPVTVQGLSVINSADSISKAVPGSLKELATPAKITFFDGDKEMKTIDRNIKLRFRNE